MEGRLATNCLICPLSALPANSSNSRQGHSAQEIVILFEIKDVAPFAYEYSQVGMATGIGCRAAKAISVAIGVCRYLSDEA
jgi:hypothetical protein